MPAPKPSRSAASRRIDPGQELGPCGLCGRPMIAGSSVDRHHLVPKTLGGREAVWIHRVCHKKIHSVLSEREIGSAYTTFEALRAQEELARFVRWVQRKDPEFDTKHRPPSKPGRKRR